MDCYKILTLLTKFDEKPKNVIDDEQIRIILKTAHSSIPEDVLNEIVQDRNVVSNVNDTGWHYLHLILYTVKNLCDTELAQDNPLFTVDQFKSFKTAIEVATSVGIIPSLLPQIKTHVNSMRSRTFKLKLDDDSIVEKYKRISYTTNILLECYDQLILRPALISQLDCLLIALLQLSHAPLKKPATTQNTTSTNSNLEFEMTIELYTKFKEEQDKFCQKLNMLIEDCPQTSLIKELMVILSIKNNPKWLQMNIKRYLTDRIMVDNGIAALTQAICEEISDMGKCWDKLDVTARLVATSHGPDVEKYYDSGCSQILGMLSSKNNRQENIIASCCIKALYDYNPDVCINKIFNAIMDPFLVKLNNESEPAKILKTEDKVSECIENLCKLFLTTDAEFKCLPIKILSRVTLPLFYLYVKSYKSIYVLRDKVRQLLLKIFASTEELRETIFSMILNHQEPKTEFAEKLNFCFGANGGFEVTSETLSVDYEELADCLFDLIVKDGRLSFDLFTYLLKALPELNETSQKAQEGKLLETTVDTMDRIEKQITAMKLLTLLSSSSLVQEEQIKNPEPLLNLIKFFFTKLDNSAKKDDTSTYEQDAGILYTSLMLVKIILTDGKVAQTWKTYQDFVTSIKKQFDFKKIPQHVVSIVEEIETIVKKKGKTYSNYYDLSSDSTKLSEFDKALADFTDPLLPVRAHGIIALTKLIERRHPDAMMKKDFLLCAFQENLSHDDSFIYLAAINGICAMSSMFPEKIIEILVQEFIGMTQQTGNRDIAPETRVKLGEILVKTTRALGEMTPKYKSLLVNGFLCGAKDPDPLVRASSLSCLGEFCKIMGFRLGNLIIEILYCIGCIIKTDKDDGCRRAGVLVATMLLRGLGKDALIELGDNLVPLYRAMKHLRDTDKDPVLQLHAQLALEEFNDIVQQFLFAKPKLEKSIFLLS